MRKIQTEREASGASAAKRALALRKAKKMINGGVATIFVSDFDRAVRFYTETLGLKLTHRFGNDWASLEAPGFAIGLHPSSEKAPAGKSGSIIIGLSVDEPIHEVVERLKGRGVRFRGPVIEEDAVRLAYFHDPDGNELYLSELRADFSSS